jgi:hypothetical protein
VALKIANHRKRLADPEVLVAVSHPVEAEVSVQVPV